MLSRHANTSLTASLITSLICLKLWASSEGNVKRSEKLSDTVSIIRHPVFFPVSWHGTWLAEPLLAVLVASSIDLLRAPSALQVSLFWPGDMLLDLSQLEAYRGLKFREMTALLE